MRLRTAATIAALAVAAGLSACATATPYQPNIRGQQVSGGFSETQLEPDRFRVNFAGNSLTSRETVEGYLLFRAAELTVAEGYDYFVIVDRDTDRKTRTYVEPDPFYRPYWGPGLGYWRPHWRYYGVRYGGWRSWDPWYGDPFWGDRVDVRTVDKYEASAEIQMHRGAKPEGDPRAFDARAVMDSLRPRLQLPT
ncbi:MAG: hypothetical protein IT546_03330 [Caulobacteraceae bacterium]|nr:hypothetical protein [Caulobacteraceae bacterium]